MGLASLFGTWIAQGLNPFRQCLALLSTKLLRLSLNSYADLDQWETCQPSIRDQGAVCLCQMWDDLIEQACHNDSIVSLPISLAPGITAQATGKTRE